MRGNMRCRPCSTPPQAALAGGGSAEQAALQSCLTAAVGNQRRLAAWHALQAGLTQAVDYAGAVIAYCCVALAIFSGAQFELNMFCNVSTASPDLSVWWTSPLRLTALTQLPDTGCRVATGSKRLRWPSSRACVKREFRRSYAHEQVWSTLQVPDMRLERCPLGYTLILVYVLFWAVSVR